MDGGSNRGALLNGVTWTEAGLSFLFVAGRFYARSMVTSKAGWEDALMVVALILMIAATGVLSAAVSYGLGSHQKTLSPDNVRMALMLQWAYQPLQVISGIIARFSISILLIRLFPSKRIMKWFLIILAAFNALVGAIALILIFTQCTPTAKLWDHGITGGHCVDGSIHRNLAMFKGTISAFSDIAVAIWPIIIIWRLQMKEKTKIILACVFGLSMFATIACIIEVYYIRSINTKRDQTYVSALIAIWISTGANSIIILGSTPTLRPLHTKWFGTSPECNRRSAFRLVNGVPNGGHELANRRNAADPNYVKRSPHNKGHETTSEDDSFRPWQGVNPTVTFCSA